jgi:tRNA-specific 2-thiouridylase
MKSVLVGLSGGIDSAMTALVLKDKGYQVTGVHFNFTESGINHQDEKLGELKKKLDIEIIEHDSKQLFDKEVIGYYTRFHLSGRTPSPCSHCNPSVKWKLLHELAEAKNIDFYATGHYVKNIKENDLFRIYRGIDTRKDQSYYLWKLDQKILNRALTPLGDYYKNDIKTLAIEKEYDFLIGKKESAGLCFSNGRNCEQMLNDYIPDLPINIKPGNILDQKGKIIGRHKGYIYYTIGQKSGFELDIDDKLCISEIDAKKNLLFADTWQNLYKEEFFIEDYLFPDQNDIENNDDIQTVIRGFGLNPTGKSTLIPENNHIIRVKLETPAWAPAPGQPAVFYSGNKLLGGGIIC